MVSASALISNQRVQGEKTGEPVTPSINTPAESVDSEAANVEQAGAIAHAAAKAPAVTEAALSLTSETEKLVDETPAIGELSLQDEKVKGDSTVTSGELVDADDKNAASGGSAPRKRSKRLQKSGRGSPESSSTSGGAGDDDDDDKGRDERRRIGGQTSFHEDDVAEKDEEDEGESMDTQEDVDITKPKGLTTKDIVLELHNERREDEQEMPQQEQQQQQQQAQAQLPVQDPGNPLGVQEPQVQAVPESSTLSSLGASATPSPASSDAGRSESTSRTESPTDSAGSPAYMSVPERSSRSKSRSPRRDADDKTTC